MKNLKNIQIDQIPNKTKMKNSFQQIGNLIASH